MKALISLTALAGAAIVAQAAQTVGPVPLLTPSSIQNPANLPAGVKLAYDIFVDHSQEPRVLITEAKQETLRGLLDTPGVVLTVPVPDRAAVILESFAKTADRSWSGRAGERGEAEIVLGSSGITGTLTADNIKYRLHSLGSGWHIVVWDRPDMAHAPPTQGSQCAAPPEASCRTDDPLTVLVVGDEQLVSAIDWAAEVAGFAVQLEKAIQAAGSLISVEVIPGVVTTPGPPFPTVDEALAWAEKSPAFAKLMTAQHADVAVFKAPTKADKRQGVAGARIAAVARNHFFTTTHVPLHEIGHLFGAGHNQAFADQCYPSPARGFIQPDGDWITVMSYPDSCKHLSSCNSAVPCCRRLAHWSNPNAEAWSHTNGANQKIGSATENNSAVIDANLTRVSRYACSAGLR